MEPANTNTKKLLTEEEACDFLRVSRDALAKFRRDKADPLPFMKAGRRYLYLESELISWAKRQARRSSPGRRLRRRLG